MATPSYANILQEVQSRLYNLISTDITTYTFSADSQTFTVGIGTNNATVVDGIPKKLIQGTGYPYIIIPTGEVTEEILTMTKKKVRITTRIEIYARREKSLRIMSDRIREILETNKNTANWSAAGLAFKNITSSSLNSRLRDDGDMEYNMMFFVEHVFYGD
jgi:hypothetical protein